MEGLNFDQILDNDQIDDLFVDENETQDQEDPKKDNKDTTEVVDTDELFVEKPESVGSEETHEGGEDADQHETISPENTKNFYSSIANALAEEGILPDLDESKISEVKDAEQLAQLIQEQMNAGLSELQKRANEYMGIGIEPDEFQFYEQTLANLDKITEEQLEGDDEQAEKLRLNLIYYDYINRGLSEERAKARAEKSVKNATDVEDAKDALQGNKEFYRSQYQKLVDERRAQAQKQKDEQKKQAEAFKKSILDNDKVFGDVPVDKSTRKKIYDTAMLPVWKDPDTGKLYTALQKYEIQHHDEFMKNVSAIFVLTDGFTNLDKLVGGKVKKEVKKGFKELEQTLQNSNGRFGGKMTFASGVSSDPESYYGKGLRLDI